MATVLQKVAFPGIGVSRPHLCRCVVERFLAWIGGNRCLARDFRIIASANAFFKETSGILLLCITCRRA